MQRLLARRARELLLADGWRDRYPLHPSLQPNFLYSLSPVFKHHQVFSFTDDGILNRFRRKLSFGLKTRFTTAYERTSDGLEGEMTYLIRQDSVLRQLEGQEQWFRALQRCSLSSILLNRLHDIIMNQYYWYPTHSDNCEFRNTGDTLRMYVRFWSSNHIFSLSIKRGSRNCDQPLPAYCDFQVFEDEDGRIGYWKGVSRKAAKEKIASRELWIAEMRAAIFQCGTGHLCDTITDVQIQKRDESPTRGVL